MSRPMSEIRAIARAARPDGLLDLSRSEPLPIAVPAACAARMQEEFSRARHYSPPGGLAVLREAIARRLSAATGASITAEQTIATAGATAGIAMALRALVPPGAEVLIPTPHYSAHPQQVLAAGARPRWVATSQGAPTPEALLREIGPDTGALLLVNPANPTGAVLQREALREILRALPPRVAVIGDEVYAEYLYRDPFTSVFPLVMEEDAGRKVVVVQSASKSAAMPGWRVGSAVTRPVLAPELARAASALAGPPSTPAQVAYATWLEAPPRVDRMAPYRPRLRDALPILEERFSVVPPQGTYYLWASSSEEIGSIERVLAIAAASGVLVAPGILYGDAKSVRISLSVPRQELLEGLTRLTEAARDLSFPRPRS